MCPFCSGDGGLGFRVGGVGLRVEDLDPIGAGDGGELARFAAQTLVLLDRDEVGVRPFVIQELQLLLLVCRELLVCARV